MAHNVRARRRVSDRRADHTSAWPAPRRIAIVGTTGAGKTTLARRLAQRLTLPRVELDALYWQPGWRPAPAEVFRARVERALAGPAWVVDGNYAVVRDIVWRRAELLVWLDYPLPLVLCRLLRRTLRRALMREKLWNGNRERLSTNFAGRDSLFLWAIQTHARRRQEFTREVQTPEHQHLSVVRLGGPRQTAAWLAGLRARPEPAAQ
jgi:adenylate kinase family enzyme